MVRDPFLKDKEPEPSTVLSALDDPDCRDIISCMEDPMTASQLSEVCDIPLSTMYRKLERMSNATLLHEGTEIRPGGQHATRYEVNFEDVIFSLDDERNFQVRINRPARTPDERLASLWSQVREEST